jgi:hypothetical protein
MNARYQKLEPFEKIGKRAVALKETSLSENRDKEVPMEGTAGL